uniref:Diguanylate cyclase n=1 Tax=candidate division WOR-3 bacterium TaxID=2052148 RepID=A0A7C4THA6_UNCW3
MVKKAKENDQTKLLQRIKNFKNQLENLKKALLYSQAINRAVFEHSPVGITIRRGTGELLAFNKTWKKIWNLTHRQIYENERICQGKNVRQRYPFLKEFSSRVQRVFDKGGEVFIPEIHIVNHETNFDKWISQYYYAIKNIRGRVEYVVTMTQDITAQKRNAQALAESEEKFRTIFNNINLGVYRSSCSIPGKFLHINPAFFKLFNYDSAKAMLKVPVEKIYKNPKDRIAFLREIIAKGEIKNKVIQLKRKDGLPFWASIYAKAHYDENGNIKWIDGIVEDITEQKRAEEKLRALSMIDELTGFYNRRGFFTLAEHQIQISNKAKKNMLLLFIDVDNLKKINDKYGHPLGDQALVKTAEILKKTFRESDIIARIGGDEFVVFTMAVPGTSGKKFGGRLEKNLEFFNEKAKLPFALSLSIGWSCYDPRNPQTLIQLLKDADRMMYLNKRFKKKNRLFV